MKMCLNNAHVLGELSLSLNLMLFVERPSKQSMNKDFRDEFLSKRNLSASQFYQFIEARNKHQSPLSIILGLMKYGVSIIPVIGHSYIFLCSKNCHILSICFTF